MIHLLKVAIPPSLADLFVSLAHSGTVSSASRICIMPKNSTNRHRTIQSAPLGRPGDRSRTALTNLHIAQGVVRISAAVHSSESVQFTADLTFVRLQADDARSNSVRHRRSQKLRLRASQEVRARLYTATGWRSVPPREGASRISLPSRQESTSAARVRVEAGKEGSLYPFG